jgi:pentatricopeptide repeat protein
MASMASDLFAATAEGTEWHPAVAPNKESFEVLIQVFCLASEWQKALLVIDDMAHFSIEPDASTYNHVFRKLAKRNPLGAEDLFTTMTNGGIMPDSGTMDAFLIGYLSTDRPESGISMVQGLFNQYGAKPSQSAFLHVLTVFIRAGQRPLGSPDPRPHAVKPLDPREVQRAATVFRQFWPGEEDKLATLAASLYYDKEL